MTARERSWHSRPTRRALFSADPPCCRASQAGPPGTAFELPAGVQPTLGSTVRRSGRYWRSGCRRGRAGDPAGPPAPPSAGARTATTPRGRARRASSRPAGRSSRDHRRGLGSTTARRHRTPRRCQSAAATARTRQALPRSRPTGPQARLLVDEPANRLLGRLDPLHLWRAAIRRQVAATIENL